LPLLDRSDVAFFTPTGWRIVLSAGWSGSKRVCGASAGEPLPLDVAQALVPRMREMWVSYFCCCMFVWLDMLKMRLCLFVFFRRSGDRQRRPSIRAVFGSNLAS
jgi:hypothetical protein